MILRSRDSSRLVSRLLRRKSAATNHYSISQPSMLQTYKIPKDRNENEAQPGERPDNDKERSETSRDTSDREARTSSTGGLTTSTNSSCWAIDCP